ncbi:LysR family transcriptional regulator [Enterobacter cloacae]|uniref:LysR family transcriptional regulator n=1 Tax=Enterobacter cloacae TaxID=550 RepID=A0A377M7C3_ENTCL|nr:LysR family transcriptional regulator [Enterobacter cloacae]
MANLYDLKKFDLNLLVIFECIYQHLSISKAAETLYITPSAVSQSLQRLRNQLNDRCLSVREKGSLPPPLGQICIIILSKTSISLSRPSTSCMAHRSKRILSSTARRF